MSDACQNHAIRGGGLRYIRGDDQELLQIDALGEARVESLLDVEIDELQLRQTRGFCDAFEDVESAAESLTLLQPEAIQFG